MQVVPHPLSVVALSSGSPSRAAGLAIASCSQAILDDDARGAGASAPRLWTELLSGGYSVVNRRRAAGQRHLMVARNPAATAKLRALSSAERDVVEQVARGLSNKEVAWELDVREARAKALLHRAQAKLGIAGRVELIRLARALATVRVGPADALPEVFWLPLTTVELPPSLSPVEREVVSCVLDGAATASIAERRGVSRRTVENQLACVYRKLGVFGRSELTAKLLATASR